MAGGFDASVNGGPEQLAALGRDLKAAGAKELKKELLATGRRLGKVFKAGVEAHALSDLPSRGGLNVWVSRRIKVSAQTRLSANATFRFVTKHPGKNGLSDLRALNAGKVRHPLYGNTDYWYLQIIPGKFVDNALDEMGEDIRAEFLQAVDNVARQLRG